mgnify:CR=1 FL=1
MKVILASAAALAMSTSLVLAQSAAPEGGAARSTAKSHLEEARQAKTAGQEQQCLESLVMAQNDVLEKANSQRAPAPTPN